MVGSGLASSISSFQHVQSVSFQHNWLEEETSRGLISSTACCGQRVTPFSNMTQGFCSERLFLPSFISDPSFPP